MKLSIIEAGMGRRDFLKRSGVGLAAHATGLTNVATATKSIFGLDQTQAASFLNAYKNSGVSDSKFCQIWFNIANSALDGDVTLSHTYWDENEPGGGRYTQKTIEVTPEQFNGFLLKAAMKDPLEFVTSCTTGDSPEVVSVLSSGIYDKILGGAVDHLNPKVVIKHVFDNIDEFDGTGCGVDALGTWLEFLATKSNSFQKALGIPLTVLKKISDTSTSNRLFTMLHDRKLISNEQYDEIMDYMDFHTNRPQEQETQPHNHEESEPQPEQSQPQPRPNERYNPRPDDEYYGNSMHQAFESRLRKVFNIG